MSRERIAAAGAVGVVGLTACLSVGVPSSVASSSPACRAGQLQFGKPLAQGINSISIGYGVSVENVGDRACTLHRFLIVRVPKAAPAAVDTYLVLTTPCGGVDAFVALRLQLAVEVPYGQAERFFSMLLPARGCRHRSNQIELWPLTAT